MGRSPDTTPSRRERLSALFDGALGLPSQDRRAFLEEACGDDPELIEEITALLDAHGASGAYFDALSDRVVGPTLAALLDASVFGVQEGLRATLSGQYRIERELAGAGMSRVFVAEDLRLRRHVVIKVLPPSIVPTTSSERFQREIELAAQLQHPCIVPVLTADASGASSYYTMPFVDGDSLRERLFRDGALPVREAVRIWRDVLDALAYAHAHGVIHRDIKPGNILLSGRHALVTDFGIARALEEAGGDPQRGAHGPAVGTPAYMAPEQALGAHDADERVDVYQAGLVMFEMLEGALPFGARTLRDSLAARVDDDPAPLARPDAPERLRALVMRCIARLPAERPSSAQDVLLALEGFDPGGGAPSARNVSAGSRPTGRSARRWAAGALVSLAVGVTWMMMSRKGPDDPRQVGVVPEPPTIAVLPLVDLAGNPENAPVADGLTEELSSILGRSADLRVVSTTSVAALQGLGLDARQIADSLRASHVVEGSIQRDGSHIRMQIRLVDAKNGSTRWSETYDREFGAVLDVQAEVARAVARELAARLSGNAATAGDLHSGARDIAAHEWYLRGMDLSLLRSGAGTRRGIEYFQNAVALDSTYAAAYAGLSRLYMQLWNRGPATEQQAWLSLARDAAERAVALDSSDPDALSAIGWVRIVDRDYEGSESAFNRALALNPSASRGHEGLARLYMMLDRPIEELAEARLGLALDPYSHSAIREVALALATNGRCEESLDQLEPLKSLTPPAAVAGVLRGQCYASRRMWPQAIDEFQWAADQGATFAPAFLGYSLAGAGRRSEAAAILDDMLAGRVDSHGAFGIATVYAGMGDLEQAFVWLDRAIDQNGVNPYLMHPIFAGLRGDLRFAATRARLGLPPAN